MLAAATEAVGLAPADAWARRLLGRVHRELEDYEEAERQLEIALDLEPGDTNTLGALVDCHVGRSWTQIALRDRLAAQQRSLEVLRSILDRTDDARITRWVQFWLGFGQFNLGVFEKAAYHFTVAMRLRYRPLTAQVFLCRIHYYRGAYNYADESLRAVVSETRRLSRLHSPAPGGKKVRSLPEEMEEETPVNDTLLMAALWRSLVYAERGMDLRRARRMTRRARWRLQYCLPAVRAQYLAACLACEGWIAHLGGDSNGAIGLLTESVRLTADPDTFWRLARICLELAEEQTATRHDWQRKLANYCREARAADMWGRYTDRLAALEAAVPRSV
jgi:tetratricopeptide (TPR) repeat protein